MLDIIIIIQTVTSHTTKISLVHIISCATKVSFVHNYFDATVDNMVHVSAHTTKVRFVCRSLTLDK